MTTKTIKTSASAVKTPTTCADLFIVANLPYSQATGPISSADPALVESCFKSIYPNFGYGYMHASDHKAALVILLGREPTFREVQDSYHLTGSRNIDAARIKSGTGADNRPTGWPDWNEFQRKVAVLTHLYGASRGGRIADGKAKDPDPEKTRALMTLWSLGDETTTEPEPKPKPEPKPEPVEPIEPKDPPVPPTPPRPVPSISAVAVISKTRIELNGSRTTTYYAIGPQRDNEQQAIEDAGRLQRDNRRQVI